VTVCIAAIAARSHVIGVSDRMLTSGSNGDIEFETGQAKLWRFSPSIYALVAGDMAIQSEILKRVNIETKDKIDAAPEKWLTVKSVADLYCRKVRELRREWAEAEILHPIGLDFSSFFDKQSSMHAEIATNLANKLTEYEFPSVLETIFLGIDNDGPTGEDGKVRNCPQLYVTYYDRLTWMSTTGFAAIGIGKNHAESQFIFSQHWVAKPFDETLLLAYAAKKRAESAPGVGRQTDIIVVGPLLGQSVKVEEKHLEGIDKIYRKSRRASGKAIDKADKEMTVFMNGVRKEFEDRRKKEEEEKGATKNQMSEEEGTEKK
jgi:hypothetical protein